ncbi:MAG: hypothetical protein WCH61_08290, partial [bacterium]
MPTAREEHPKDTSPANPVFHRDATFMRPQDAQDDRKPQPSSGEFGGEERFEQPVNIRFRYPAARVHDLQAGIG